MNLPDSRSARGSKAFDDVVEAAADELGRISKGLRSVRLRGSGEPPGTGMEADCTFHIGEPAGRYRAASGKGKPPPRRS